MFEQLLELVRELGREVSECADVTLDVEQQNDAIAIGAIPRFVQAEVVEGEHLAGAPGALLAANAQCNVARRHDESEMHAIDVARITAIARVRHNVNAGREAREAGRHNAQACRRRSENNK